MTLLPSPMKRSILLLALILFCAGSRAQSIPLGEIVGDCIPDISVNGKVLVDVKSIDVIGENEIAQVLNYLRIAEFEVGLIINFKNARLETKRVVRTRSADPATCVDLRAGLPAHRKIAAKYPQTEVFLHR